MSPRTSTVHCRDLVPDGLMFWKRGLIRNVCLFLCASIPIYSTIFKFQDTKTSLELSQSLSNYILHRKHTPEHPPITMEHLCHMKFYIHSVKVYNIITSKYCRDTERFPSNIGKIPTLLTPDLFNYSSNEY